MTDVKIKNVNQNELNRFDQFCKSKESDRATMLRKFIKNFSEFEAVIDTELRMKAIVDEVIEHIDLNTQAYLMNVKLGYLPVIENLVEKGEDGDETIYDSTEQLNGTSD